MIFPGTQTGRSSGVIRALGCFRSCGTSALLFPNAAPSSGLRNKVILLTCPPGRPHSFRESDTVIADDGLRRERANGGAGRGCAAARPLGGRPLSPAAGRIVGRARADIVVQA